MAALIATAAGALDGGPAAGTAGTVSRPRPSHRSPLAQVSAASAKAAEQHIGQALEWYSQAQAAAEAQDKAKAADRGEEGGQKVSGCCWG